MAIKCGNCGHENPGHIVYCGQCGESIAEPPASAQSNGEETDSSQPVASEPSILLQRQVSKGSAGLSQYSAATIVALAGVILLILSLAFFIFYHELSVDYFLDLREARERGDIDLMRNLGKAHLYSMMAGETCVVLAILSLVYGSLMRQRLGMGLASMAYLPLPRIRLLIALALACVTTAFVLSLLYTEAWIDLDTEGLLRLQGLTTDLHSAAWVFVSIVLFMVARRMQQGVKSSN